MTTKKRAAAIPRKLKTLVLDSLRRHAWNIGVTHYKCDVLYMAEDEQTDSDKFTEADIHVDRRYLTATLKIYPHCIDSWKKEGDAHIELVISHEVAHLATQHLYHVATARYCDDGEMKDAWETCTEVVGRLSLKLDQKLRKHA